MLICDNLWTNKTQWTTKKLSGKRKEEYEDRRRYKEGSGGDEKGWSDTLSHRHRLVNRLRRHQRRGSGKGI